MKLETTNLDWHELHELLGSLIAPLPIGLISTIGHDGIYNAAPFSFMAPVCLLPPIICFSSGFRRGQKKDTVLNIEFSHDFVINIVDESIIKQVLLASYDYPSNIDEINEVVFTPITSEKVRSPRIAEAKASLECQLLQKLELVEGQGLRTIIFGKVPLFHVNDELFDDGKFNHSRLKAVGRIGKDLYCRMGEIFEMKPFEY